MKSVYSKKHLLHFDDCDGSGYAKASRLIKRLQGIGTLQLEEAGVSYEDMFEQGRVFILSKLTAKFLEPPKYKDNINLSTWPHKLKGVRFLRNYIVKDEQNKTVVEVATSWVCINPTTKKIIKPNQVDIGLNYLDEALSINTFTKYRSPAELQKIKQREVVYSDLDINGHINNTVYADIMCDCIGLKSASEIDLISIDFLREATQGDMLNIGGYTEGSESWLKGYIGDDPCFSGYIKLK